MVKNLKDNKDCTQRFCGIRPVHPNLVADASLAKQWKTKNAAIEYAIRLSTQLEAISYNIRVWGTGKYYHEGTCAIKVINIDTSDVVFTIDKRAYIKNT